jgi:hypothetical protein
MHVTKTLRRVGLCDKDRVLIYLDALRDADGFRVGDALEAEMFVRISASVTRHDSTESMHGSRAVE